MTLREYRRGRSGGAPRGLSLPSKHQISVKNYSPPANETISMYCGDFMYLHILNILHCICSACPVSCSASVDSIATLASRLKIVDILVMGYKASACSNRSHVQASNSSHTALTFVESFFFPLSEGELVLGDSP